MKLLYITNGINGAGGLERVLSIKASYMAEHYGYEVTILSLNEGRNSPFYEFSPKIKMRSISVAGNPIQYFKSYKKGVQKIVDEVQPDVILVCDDGLKGFFIPNLINTKAKIIYERHASIRLNTDKGITGKFSSWLMQRQSFKFDQFVVLTRSNIKEWYSNNVIAIPNPLSFTPTSASTLKNKKIIVVGSHSHNKGYDTLLKIWKNVQPKFPAWELHIYGKADQDHTYIHYAKTLSLKQVYFHEPVTNIEQQYLDSSVMLLPSRSEGFGMVLIEAMVCGVPCISFDCPSGPGDIISDQEDGFLIENQNAEALQSALENLMKHESLRKEMGRKAKENVQRYALQPIVQLWDDLFKKLEKK